jgi:hypothetical protein
MTVLLRNRGTHVGILPRFISGVIPSLRNVVGIIFDKNPTHQQKIHRGISHRRHPLPAIPHWHTYTNLHHRIVKVVSDCCVV